jgi:hypothetical protein
MENLFPTSNAWPSPTVSFDDVDGQIGFVVTALQSQIPKALELPLSDATSFRAFAGNGTWLSNLPSLPDFGKMLTDKFNSFMVAAAFQSIGVFISRAPNTDVSQFSSKDELGKGNGTILHWNANCTSYDKNSVCDTYYFDANTKTTYSLVNPYAMDQSFYLEMTALLDPQQGYTTGVEFFSAADSCAHGANSSVPIAKLTNGPPSFECMVNIPVCTWNPITPANTDVSTLLTEVMTDCYLPEVCSTFAQGGCINPEMSRGHKGGWNVPRGYLGWAAMQAGMTQEFETSIRGIICNDKSGNW